MPKSKPAATEIIEEPEDQFGPEPSAWHRAPWWLRALGGLLAIAALLVTSFELVYVGKIYPGVTADGVYLGSLSQAEAAKKLAAKTAEFKGQVVTITNGTAN